MEFNDREAIYLQIANLICENILSGKWHEEERIPSIRDIAIDTEVNPNTVMRSFSYLQDQSIIYNKRGIGFFVTPGGKQRITEMKKRTFIESELPKVFKTMHLLNIGIDEVAELYENSSELT